MGYKSLRSFVNFGSEDIQKIQSFMQTNFLVILKKKSEKLNIDYDDELLKYYGSLWQYCPDKYEILAGHVITLEQITAVAVKLLKPVTTSLASCFQNRAAPKRKLTSHSAVTAAENVEPKEITMKNHLDQMIKTWLEDKWSKQGEQDDPDENDSIERPKPPQVTVSVAENNLGSYIAELKCPFKKRGQDNVLIQERQQCTFKCTLVHKNSRWSLISNFYRHIETQHLKKEQETRAKKRENPVVKMFEKLPKQRILNEDTSNQSLEKDTVEIVASDTEFEEDICSKKKTCKIIDYSDSEDDSRGQGHHERGNFLENPGKKM